MKFVLITDLREYYIRLRISHIFFYFFSSFLLQIISNSADGYFGFNATFKDRFIVIRFAVVLQ